MAGGAPLNVADLVGETAALTIDPGLPAPRCIVVRSTPNVMVVAMDVFTKLFGNLLAFVYHCFDRIVIHGYLSALSRPEQVVHFVRKVVGVPVVSKEILSQRTADYQNWVEAYARNHHTPIEWAEKGVRKEDYVLPLAAPNSEQERLQRLFHLQEHGAGANFSYQHAEISPARTRTTASLHASVAASPTTTSTSAIKLLAPW